MARKSSPMSSAIDHGAADEPSLTGKVTFSLPRSSQVLRPCAQFCAPPHIGQALPPNHVVE
jgi:hypothetical protein